MMYIKRMWREMIAMVTMMLISTLIWFGILVLLAIAVSFWFRHVSNLREASNDPIAILQLRLARGDISIEEYQELHKQLDKH